MSNGPTPPALGDLSKILPTAATDGGPIATLDPMTVTVVVPACSPRPIDLEKIPAAMDAHGWKEGATLLREWFNNPPGGGPPDTTTITMTWLLGIPDARKVFDRIFKDKKYRNGDAGVQIISLFKYLGFDGEGMSFDFPNAAIDAHRLHIQTEPANWWDVDMHVAPNELMASLNRFAYHVVIAGEVKRDKTTLPGTPPRYIVTIKDVGVFARDSFDFDHFQPLGYWNVCTYEVSLGIPPTFEGEYVFNKDFREWRTTHGKGGDFLIFSDVLRTTLPSPDTFYLYDDGHIEDYP